MSVVTMEKLISLCKRRGFIFPGSEIYGGLANSWDYGPLGVELKNNIKQAWWQWFVHRRSDMVGIDAAIIMSPKVWEASGHVQQFSDPLVECGECKRRFRWDHVEVYSDPPEKSFDELGPSEDILGAFWICENCKAKNLGIKTKGRNRDLIQEFGVKKFNLLFKTFIGPVEDAKTTAYLRGELAQAMFVNFRNVLDTQRVRLPFGIASQGRVFRNEITPGNFIFRTREFDLMEFEYFIRESEWEQHFEYWRKEMHNWLQSLGVAETHIHDHDIPKDELAHYSRRTIDIEYDYPFGRKELYGLAYRTDFDLKNHMEKSGADLRYMDPETNEKFIPHVVEPTFGIDRTVLVVLLEAYREEKERLVLALPPKIAPYKVAVFPLLANKPQLVERAEQIASDLRQHFTVAWDSRGNIGKRYLSQDEIGTPYCVTVDFDSLEDHAVTVRNRDSTKQERVAIAELRNYLREKFDSYGRVR